MAGTLVIDTLNASSGVLSSQNGMTGIAKAWVQFAGASGSIAASFNVSSVTRTSSGYYTVTFTTAMADTSYSAVIGTSTTSGTVFTNPLVFTDAAYTATAPLTTSFKFACINLSASYVDPVYCCVSVFR